MAEAEGQRDTGDRATQLLALKTEGRPQAKESNWPPEAGKGKETASPLEPGEKA